MPQNSVSQKTMIWLVTSSVKATLSTSGLGLGAGSSGSDHHRAAAGQRAVEPV